MWDWSTPTHYLHDAVSSDKRNPTRQRQWPDLWLARGKHRQRSGARSGQAQGDHDHASLSRSRRPRRRSTCRWRPSAYWGDEPIWDGHTSIHNPMMDEKGRVWFTARIRPNANPDFCKKGSDHPSAKGRAAQRVAAPALDVRPEDGEVVADQHLLRHPSPLFRQGRQQHAVDQRRRPGERRRRLAQYQDVRGDRRRGEVAGLDAAHRRHQRQRQA